LNPLTPGTLYTTYFLASNPKTQPYNNHPIRATLQPTITSESTKTHSPLQIDTCRNSIPSCERLVFTCDEKFPPSHRCATKHYFIIQSLKELPLDQEQLAEANPLTPTIPEPRTLRDGNTPFILQCRYWYSDEALNSIIWPSEGSTYSHLDGW